MLIESRQFDLEQRFGVLSQVTVLSASEDGPWVGIVDLEANTSFQGLPVGCYDLYVLRGALCESAIQYQRDTFMSRFDLTTLCAGVDGALVWVCCDVGYDCEYAQTVMTSSMFEWMPGGVKGMKIVYLSRRANDHLMLVSWSQGTRVRAHSHRLYEELFVLEGTLNDSIDPAHLASYSAGNWQRLHPGAAHALSVEIDTTILLRNFLGN